MNYQLIINFVNLFTNILMILILVRVVLSWIPSGIPKFRKVIDDITEPILAPIRKIVPPVGGVMDLSPIIAYVLLYLLQVIIGSL